MPIEPEMLKICTWPIVVIVLGGLALFLFKDSIRNCINNVKGFKTKDLEIAMASQAASAENIQMDKFDLLVTKYLEVLKPVEDEIEGVVRNKGVTDPAEIIKTLKKHAAFVCPRTSFLPAPETII